MQLNIKKTIIGAVAAISLLVVGLNTVHKVDDTEWQAVQHLSGHVEIKERPGIYFAFFPKVTEYPRNAYFEFSKEITDESPTDESTRVTFNDGGTADVDASLRIALPNTEVQKREFHRQFNGSEVNIKNAVWSHLANVIKASGPLMSASENQASRKSEFNTVVLNQLNEGLYEMKRVEREIDQTDEKGNKLRVAATEVITNTKTLKPMISQESPLARYGVNVTQFSITETEYDEQTRKQFSTKKDAFLQAESAKAQREGEVQQRLMIIEKGLREKAETESKANLEKAQAVISAEKEKEVAELEAAKILAVALKQKETSETQAQMKLSVAKLSKEAATEEAEQIRILAEAEKDRISQAGAITEKDKVTLEIQRETAIGVASALSKVSVPQIVISGSGGSSEGGSATQSELINLLLLKQNGYLDAMKTPTLVK